MNRYCEPWLLFIAILVLLASACVWPRWYAWPLLISGVSIVWLSWAIAHAPYMEE